MTTSFQCPSCNASLEVRPEQQDFVWFRGYKGEPHEIRPVTVKASDKIYNRSGRDETQYLLFNKQGVNPIIYDTYGQASEQQTASRNFHQRKAQ